MARPLRIEYEGACYHITARGNAQQHIFLTESDRYAFLDILVTAVSRFGWLCHAYCLMGNHYHLLLETPSANISRGMQYLNARYTQKFNRRHGRTGHVLQGRFHSVLVEKQAYLLEVVRYIELNPVRAGLVKHPAAWPWSSCRATAGRANPPDFLHVEWVLSQFHADPEQAKQAYRLFVSQGRDANPWTSLQGSILGNNAFVKAMKPLLSGRTVSTEFPRRDRLATRPPLDVLFASVDDIRSRNAKLYEAVHIHQYTITEVARFLGLHYSTVSHAVRRQHRGVRS
ncbi:MAG: transposase [Candidatus Bipolaricaulota bacterium]